MRVSFRRLCASALVCLMTADAIRPMGVEGGDLFGSFRRKVPVRAGNTPADQLACEIDRLERLIDTHGTVVAKKPDVWGESRLMMHRQEFETQMLAQLGSFDAGIQGSQYVSDQAFFASATALSAVISGSQASYRDPVTNLRTTQAAPTAVAVAVPEGLLTGASFTRTEPGKLPINKLSDVAVSLEPSIRLDQRARFLNHLHEIRRLNEGDDIADSPGYAMNLVRVPVSVLPGQSTRTGYGAEITVKLEPVLGPELLPTTMRNLVINDLIDLLALPVLSHRVNSSGVANLNGVEVPAPDEGDASRPKAQAAPAPPARPAFQTPFTKLENIYPELTSNVWKKFQTSAPSANLDTDLVLDAHDFLRSELHAAYDLISHPSLEQEIWHGPCLNPASVADAVLSNNKGALKTIRCDFNNELNRVAVSNHLSDLTRRLAWATYVQSALLNRLMVEEIADGASRRGAKLDVNEYCVFVGPRPGEEARNLFNQYVALRWPIQVFAVDPITQDQNINDQYSRRRELQLALALSFASGRINFQNMERFARRLELDMSTIALNRTIVSFSHGADTFGWRFYPRYQTPAVKGNIAAFGETLFGGPSRDDDLSCRQIESGTRECTALVIMPSFVTSLTATTRANWFKLTNPGRTCMSMTEAVQLGRSVQCMRELSNQCAEDPTLRDGDWQRLQSRVEQLSAELPIQTATVDVPIDNSMGGSEMFANGASELAPKLYGFYGEPGHTEGADSVVYLLGNHFSVNNTKVLAGNREAKVQLLSRRVAQVTIPKDAAIDGAHVDIHVATPYGVSGHLKLHAIKAVGGGAAKPNPCSLCLQTCNGTLQQATPGRLLLAGPLVYEIPQEGVGGESKLVYQIKDGDGRSVGSGEVPLKSGRVANEAILSGTDLDVFNLDVIERLMNAAPVSTGKDEFHIEQTIEIVNQGVRILHEVKPAIGIDVSVCDASFQPLPAAEVPESKTTPAVGPALAPAPASATRGSSGTQSRTIRTSRGGTGIQSARR